VRYVASNLFWRRNVDRRLRVVVNRSATQTCGELQALLHIFVVAEPGVVVNFTPRSPYSKATSDSVLVIVALYFSNS